MNIADTLGADSGPITKPDCASRTFCGPPTVSSLVVMVSVDLVK